MRTVVVVFAPPQQDATPVIKSIQCDVDQVYVVTPVAPEDDEQQPRQHPTHIQLFYKPTDPKNAIWEYPLPVLNAEQHPDTFIVLLHWDREYRPQLVSTLLSKSIPNAAVGFSGTIVGQWTDGRSKVRCNDASAKPAQVSWLHGTHGVVWKRDWFPELLTSQMVRGNIPPELLDGPYEAVWALYLKQLSVPCVVVKDKRFAQVLRRKVKIYPGLSRKGQRYNCLTVPDVSVPNSSSGYWKTIAAFLGFMILSAGTGIAWSRSKSQSNPSKILSSVGTVAFFIVLVAAFLRVLSHDVNSIEGGEQINCSSSHTRSSRQKLDRLYELACFESTKVRWRTYFMGGVLGSIVSLYLLQVMKKSVSLPVKFLTLFLPSFFLLYCMANFHAYHGEHRNHPSHAYRLRLALEKDLSQWETRMP